jgi:hypothetical protein
MQIIRLDLAYYSKNFRCSANHLCISGFFDVQQSFEIKTDAGHRVKLRPPSADTNVDGDGDVTNARHPQQYAVPLGVSDLAATLAASNSDATSVSVDTRSGIGSSVGAGVDSISGAVFAGLGITSLAAAAAAAVDADIDIEEASIALIDGRNGIANTGVNIANGDGNYLLNVGVDGENHSEDDYLNGADDEAYEYGDDDGNQDEGNDEDGDEMNADDGGEEAVSLSFRRGDISMLRQSLQNRHQDAEFASARAAAKASLASPSTVAHHASASNDGSSTLPIPFDSASRNSPLSSGSVSADGVDGRDDADAARECADVLKSISMPSSSAAPFLVSGAASSSSALALSTSSSSVPIAAASDAAASGMRASIDSSSFLSSVLPKLNSLDKHKRRFLLDVRWT